MRARIGRFRQSLFRAHAGASQIRRHAALLVGGTMAAQVLNVLASPIIARVYSPTAIGEFGVFMAVSGLVGTLACMRYDAAIVLAERDVDAAALATVGTGATLLISLVSGVVLALFSNNLAGVLGVPELSRWAALIVGVGLGLGLSQILQMLHTRQRHFRPIAISRVSQALVAVAIQIGAGVLWLGHSSGLAVGYSVGILAQVLVLTYGSGSTPFRGVDLRAGLARARRLGRRHWRFPVFAAPGSLFVFLASQGMPALVALMFAPATVGLFFLTQRVLATPASVVAQAISPVVYERLVASRNDRVAVTRFTSTAFAVLFVLSIGPFLVLAVFGPQIFSLVFGSEWRRAGVFAALLAPRYVMQFCALPLTQSFFAFERQLAGTLWQLGLFLLGVLGLAVGGARGSEALGIGLYGLAGALMYGAIPVMAIRWAGTRWISVPSVLAGGFRAAIFETGSMARTLLSGVARSSGREDGLK